MSADSKPQSHVFRPSERASFQDLFERLLDPVFLLEEGEFTIIDVNPAGERLLGQSRTQLMGNTLVKWLSESDHTEFLKALRISRRRYYPRTLQYWLADLPEAKKTLMEMSIGQLDLGEDEKAIQVILKDITRQHEAEKKLEAHLEELKELNQRLETLSTTDEMTGLPNYRHFSKRLEDEHRRSSRYNGNYSIVFCDVDHFKHYNDRNGHPAGDEVLRRLASVLKDTTRDSDLPARYGGEEFVVLCPETSAEGALKLAERIKEAVAKTEFPHAEAQPLGKVSLSCGVSSFPQNGKTWEEVLKSADEALYQSKENGRDRITLAAPLESET